jgi:hypothetical protein
LDRLSQQMIQETGARGAEAGLSGLGARIMIVAAL